MLVLVNGIPMRHLLGSSANETRPRPTLACQAGETRPQNCQLDHQLAMARDLISIVIPVLNEAANVDRLVTRLTPVLDQLPDATWELVFVDDGSQDGTLERLRTLNADDSRIKAISFSRNFGKEIALAAGIRYATGDAVILMDADLQHPPELLSKFVARWRDGYQIVYGERQDRDTDGALRRLVSVAFYKIFNALVKTDIPKGAGDFRLLDRKAADAMNRMREASRFNKGLFSWIGFKTVGVPYTVAAREGGGGSRWNIRRLVHFALDGLTAFSTLPLRLSTLLGLIVSIVAFAYAIVTIVKTMVFGVDVPGYPSIIISVMLFAGVQLIVLGIIGEYLGRVYEEVKARPLYLVAEEIGVDAPTPIGRRHVRPGLTADTMQ
jgi:glycosyltransferase involved in cell wall biosynthesis